MKTKSELKKLFPYHDPEKWSKHANGGGWVHGSASVSDGAFIGPAAIVGGGTILGGTIWGGAWKTSPLFIQGTRHAVNHSGNGAIQIGCRNHKISEWLESFEEFSSASQYTGDELVEYLEYIQMIAKRDTKLFGNTYPSVSP